jgi:hypothetical protein
MLTGMGVISFGQSATTCSGSGTNSAIGYAQLTASYQEIFNKANTPEVYKVGDLGPAELYGTNFKPYGQ